MARFYSPKIVTDGLVFAVDAANKKSYPGSGTAWYDLSGNNNEVELINGPTFDLGNGGSLVFDGTNDFARDITYTGPYMTLNGPLTLSGWFRYYDYSTTRSTIGLVNGSNAVQMGWKQGTGSIWKWGGQTLVTYSAPPINNWFNVVLTLNGSTATTYVNGRLDTSNPSASPNSTSLASIVISSYTTAGSPERFNGNLARFSFYNRILTPSEISQNYNALKSRFGL